MKIQLTSKQKIWEGNTEKQAENEKKKKKANKSKRWMRKKIQNKQLFLIIIEFHHPRLPFFSAPTDLCVSIMWSFRNRGTICGEGL